MTENTDAKGFDLSTYDADYPAELYALLHEGNPGDVEFYAEVCRGAQRVLELGCGDGRVLRGLDPAIELRLGLDLHEGLLARAKELSGTQEGLHFLRGDMRDPKAAIEAAALEGAPLRFDRIIVPHGGLYCLLDPADLDRCLGAVHGLLAPGGELVFDVWAADDFHGEHQPEEQDDAWQDHLGRFELEGRVLEIIERSTWDRDAQRIDVVYTHVEVGAHEAVEGRLPQRYFTSEEIRARVGAAGFEDLTLAGGFDFAPLDAASEVLVGRARRA